MGDEDWDTEATSGVVAAPSNNDAKNDDSSKFGFRSLDVNNNEDAKFGGGGAFKRQNDNGGFGNRRNNDENGERKGFGGGGFGRRNDENGGGGFGGGFRRQNNEEGGERKTFGRRRDNDNDENKGGFGGFGNRRNNDENGERKSFGGGGGGFRRNNDENGERKSFGGGGFNRRNDENGGGGGFGGGFRRQNNEEGGERKGFNGGFRRNNDENGGDRRGASGFGRNFRAQQNDENGENKGDFGSFKKEDDGEGGEKKGFGGFGSRQNDDNGENKGDFGGFKKRGDGSSERKGFGGGFRRNNDENGERKGFGGGFNRRNDENGGGFGGGFKKQNDEEGGEKKGFGGGFRRNNDENGENKGFGGGFNRRNDENPGGFGGGFKKQNDEEGGEKKGFGGFGKSEDNENADGESKPFGSRGFGSGSRGGRGGGRGGGGFRGDRAGGDHGERGERFGNRDGESKGEGGVEGEEKKERYIPPPIDEDEASLFHTIPTGINFKKQSEIPVNLSGENSESIKPMNSFDEADFSDVLRENIKRSKYEVPTPVQKYSIPIIMQRRDLMACAQTGSGKTAAYILPILKNILHDGVQSGELSPVQTPQALILAPTRELARQILTECRKFSYKSIIKSNILYGGTVTGFQISEISKGTNVLVATPGRLMDIINKGKISLEKLKYIVLDEADRMLDLGFESSVREILSKCTLEKSERCTFMFSATFPKEIQKLAQDYLNNYLFLTIGVVGGANTDVEQIIYKTTQFEKRNKLLEMLNDIGNERTMIFIEHKKQADILAFFLCQKKYPATSIHGDRLQSQREKALGDFTKGEAKIIVCTQVAARGLDISDVNHVINYDLPQTIDEYVHRIGRTGRCGNTGKAISFFDEDSQNDRNLARNLVRILMQASKEVPDWLNAIAENAIGSEFTDNKCTKDIRDGFKSLALTTPAPAAKAAQGEEDEW